MSGNQFETLKQPYQAKVNPFTGETFGVASKANERGPREKQASLLLWAEERERLQEWDED